MTSRGRTAPWLFALFIVLAIGLPPPAAAALYWSKPYGNDGCVGNGVRNRWSKLMNVPWFQSWQEACEAEIHNHPPVPTSSLLSPALIRCDTSITGVYANWQEKDPTCVPRFLPVGTGQCTGKYHQRKFRAEIDPATLSPSADELYACTTTSATVVTGDGVAHNLRPNSCPYQGCAPCLPWSPNGPIGEWLVVDPTCLSFA